MDPPARHGTQSNLRKGNISPTIRQIDYHPTPAPHATICRRSAGRREPFRATTHTRRITPHPRSSHPHVRIRGGRRSYKNPAPATDATPHRTPQSAVGAPAGASSCVPQRTPAASPHARVLRTPTPAFFASPRPHSRRPPLLQKPAPATDATPHRTPQSAVGAPAGASPCGPQRTSAASPHARVLRTPTPAFFASPRPHSRRPPLLQKPAPATDAAPPPHATICRRSAGRRELLRATTHARPYRLGPHICRAAYQTNKVLVTP